MLMLAASSPVALIVEKVPRKLSAIPAFFVSFFIWSREREGETGHHKHTRLMFMVIDH